MSDESKIGLSKSNPHPSSPAFDYARLLLRSVGFDDLVLAGTRDDAAYDWRVSGLMPLTGPADGPAKMGPGVLPSCARGALDVFRAMAGGDVLPGVNGGSLLAERAALLALTRHGNVSANGTCRLYAAADGWIALNLARDEDRGLIPAWLQTSEVDLETAIAVRSRGALLERGRLLGLPVASVGEYPVEPWVRVDRLRDPAPSGLGSGHAGPLVVDLSALWAGPLCTHLLERAGARVIKIESTARPDASREGSPPFFELINAGKESVALDLATKRGIARLTQLLGAADIVVESARPRALAQMGIDAAATVRGRPGLTWLSITGYGRRPPYDDWVAFGDDAAVAAGIVAEGPSFCGDAIADPLTGIHAAIAAWAFAKRGGGVLIDVSLTAVAAHCLRFSPARAVGAGCALAPGVRAAEGVVQPLGADTARVLREFKCS
ncbi:MAG: CoA transferase [Gammaproteobacteria bacterium]|nr:CoA transferase [Gammaproteobacteria bacterium]